MRLPIGRTSCVICGLSLVHELILVDIVALEQQVAARDQAVGVANPTIGSVAMYDYQERDELSAVSR